MKKALPALLLMEPASQERRRRLSDTVRGSRYASQPNREDVISRLREIRSYSAAHVEELLDALRKRMDTFRDISCSFVRDAGEVVTIIRKIAGERPIVANRSAVVENELLLGLVSAGCRIVDSYDQRLAADDQAGEGRRVTIASLPFESRFESFGKPRDLRDVRNGAIKTAAGRDFVGLLGLNAVSAAEGSLVLLQHASNISRLFREAGELVFIAGTDKIVASPEDALFQTKCMGVFGADALPLSPPSGSGAGAGFEELLARLPLVRANQKIRLIVFDNGRRDLLRSEYGDYFLCIGCRACTAVCPANQSGKPLSPRNIVSNLKNYLPHVGPGLLDGEAPPFPDSAAVLPIDGRIEEDAIWACTMCHACTTICPLELRHTDAIMGLRRNLAMIATSNRSSRAIRNPLRNTELRGHPWTGINLPREAWTAGLDIGIMADHGRDIDLLYWVGCTPNLDERSAKVPRATASLMKKGGIEFAILGNEEACCGEPCQRLGHEYLFELQAKRNVSILTKYEVRKIVTSCPHCYNMLKNEYPRFGGEYEVIHHTELFDNLYRKGRLELDRGVGKAVEAVTYQDPCCLGRDNGVYEPPRNILRAVTGKIREMDRNRENSFCCGGGGGRIWLEEHIGQRISCIRVEEALRTGAGTIATACPFCLLMFEDAIKAKGFELKALDIAELLEGVGSICKDGKDQRAEKGRYEPCPQPSIGA